MKLKSSHYLIILLTVGGAVAFLSASWSIRKLPDDSEAESDFDRLESDTSGRSADTAQDESSVWYDA